MRIRWGAMGCLLCGLALATPAISQDGAGQARAEADRCTGRRAPAPPIARCTGREAALPAR